MISQDTYKYQDDVDRLARYYRKKFGWCGASCTYTKLPTYEETYNLFMRFMDGDLVARNRLIDSISLYVLHKCTATYSADRIDMFQFIMEYIITHLHKWQPRKDTSILPFINVVFASAQYRYFREHHDHFRVPCNADAERVPLYVEDFDMCENTIPLAEKSSKDTSRVLDVIRKSDIPAPLRETVETYIRLGDVSFLDKEEQRKLRAFVSYVQSPTGTKGRKAMPSYQRKFAKLRNALQEIHNDLI